MPNEPRPTPEWDEAQRNPESVLSRDVLCVHYDEGHTSEIRVMMLDGRPSIAIVKLGHPASVTVARTAPGLADILAEALSRAATLEAKAEAATKRRKRLDP